jgi:tetratricopeptide (TPR) repeat protein
MSKDKIQLLSPLFLKYQADYEKNPRSRVFAPLAEIYRKLGMTDKAMEILAQGIRFHPTYIMGYLGLSFCYFDLKQYTLAYNTLRPIVETSRDNIRLQKLFADVCLELGYKEEALDAYKYLLFINPRDKEVSQQVTMLENMIETQYKPVHQPIFIPESEFSNDTKSEKSKRLFDIDKLENKPDASKVDFDDWKTLDLRSEYKAVEENSYDSWNLNKETSIDFNDKKPAIEPWLEEVVTPKTTTQDRSNEFQYHDEEIFLSLDDDDDEDDDEEERDLEEIQVEEAVPMVTHTLVDLYCGQGHIEKALEVLEKILILNPNDQKTINKIDEIKALMEPIEIHQTPEPVQKPVPVNTSKKEFKIPNLTRAVHELPDEATEEEGRKNLMSILDQQLANVDLGVISELAKNITEDKKPKESKEVKKPSPAVSGQELQRKRKLEEKLNLFLKKIQKRALDYQARV